MRHIRCICTTNRNVDIINRRRLFIPVRMADIIPTTAGKANINSDSEGVMALDESRNHRDHGMGFDLCV